MALPSYTQGDFSDYMRKQIDIDLPDLETVIEWIKKNLEPDDVFSENQLSNWAEKNEYEKTE